MTRLLATLTAAVGVLALGGAANAAPISIDTLVTPPGNSTILSATAPAGATTGPVTGLGINGTRTITLTQTGASVLPTQVGIGDGVGNLAGLRVIDVNGANGAVPTVTVDYGNPGFVGGSITNPTFALPYDLAGLNTLNATLSLNGGAFTQTFLGLSGTGVANFGFAGTINITSASLILTAGIDGGDFTVGVPPGGFRLVDEQIPEPATLAICGIFGLAGVVGARRKLKAKAAEATAA